MKLEGEEVLADALNIFLQYYRSTPSAVLENKSPSELMFGQKVKTTLDRSTSNSRTYCSKEFENGKPI